MEFRTFPVASTNIFPQSNSKTGGQLVTEFNLRSREMVATDSHYGYEIGPSFLHSETDFLIGKQVSKVDLTKNSNNLPSTILTISSGRAVINGHFVQVHTDMTIDMLEANARAKAIGEPEFYGSLAIGIRAVYSTEATMAGALLVEAKEDTQEDDGELRSIPYSGVYEGIQLIISDAAKMVPYSEIMSVKEYNDAVAAGSEIVHLKLATFTFVDGNIGDIVNVGSPNLQYIPGERILDAGKTFSSTYVTRPNSGSNRLYAYTGRYTEDTSSGKVTDIWCDATDSLMVWDATDESSLVATKPKVKQAQFVATEDAVKLVVPHQQPDVSDTTTGTKRYYRPVELQLPKADYENDIPGVVTPEYTKCIKDISHKLNNMLNFDADGQLVGYLEERKLTDGVPDSLPTIHRSWKYGDYILVRHDQTLGLDIVPNYGYVSTMYKIITGDNPITSLQYYGGKCPDSASGPIYVEVYTASNYTFPKFDIGHEFVGNVKDADWLEANNYVGHVGQFFRVIYQQVDDSKSGTARVIAEQEYCFQVQAVEEVLRWSEGVLLTAPVSLAQEEVVGGFRNVPKEALDEGYVWLNENGHLQLLDYDKLRSGTLAYQLGDHISISSGLTVEAIQEELDEYVNNRVAFPSKVLAGEESEFNVIEVTLNLSELTEADGASGVINICNIDSRFNTSVCLNIKGTADSKTTINICDCEKIRIGCIEGNPVVNVYRSNLYYDAAIFNKIRTNGRETTEEGNVKTSAFLGMYQIKLWYERYGDVDPELYVDGMTVISSAPNIIPNEIDFWNSTNPNDKHVHTALHSVTFSDSGDIIKCELLIQDKNTNQLDGQRKVLIGDFDLPNNSNLQYPVTCLTKSLKVTGSFVTSHQNSDAKWTISDISFTAVTGAWDGSSSNGMSTGSLSLHSVSNYMAIENVNKDHAAINKYDPNGQYIPGWDITSYHMFAGGVIG